MSSTTDCFISGYDDHGNPYHINCNGMRGFTPNLEYDDDGDITMESYFLFFKDGVRISLPPLDDSDMKKTGIKLKEMMEKINGSC